MPDSSPRPDEPLPEPLLARLHRALGPLAGGLILDVVDLAMFGPLGLLAGPVVGAAVGWWVSSLYRLSATDRVVFAALAALYVSFPLTEVLPIATLISAFARFQPRGRTPASDPAVADGRSRQGGAEASQRDASGGE